MDLKNVYGKMYINSIASIENSSYEVDEFIDSKLDDRFGVTLLIRPNAEIKNKINELIADLREIDSTQYYYEMTDAHVTVLSIISCYSGFSLEQINKGEYVKLISKSLAGINKFKIQFNGITASKSGIMIQGYYSDDSLRDIRDALRINFNDSNLDHSIDKRYKLVTAHITVVRFKNKINRTAEFIETLNKYRNYAFGGMVVGELEFVYNDWYQTKDKVELIKRYKLK